MLTSCWAGRINTVRREAQKGGVYEAADGTAGRRGHPDEGTAG